MVSSATNASISTRGNENNLDILNLSPEEIKPTTDSSGPDQMQNRRRLNNFVLFYAVFCT